MATSGDRWDQLGRQRPERAGFHGTVAGMTSVASHAFATRKMTQRLDHVRRNALETLWSSTSVSRSTPSSVSHWNWGPVLYLGANETALIKHPGVATFAVERLSLVRGPR